jgi:hypothetical protein
MEKLVRIMLVVFAASLAGSGLVVSAGARSSAPSDAEASNFVAVVRDEEEFAILREGVGEQEDDSRDWSNSRDRSRDATTRDVSRSRDRSRDRTGDRVGVPDRSVSRDLSRDRTGDHDTPDVSKSRDRSADNTATRGGDGSTNTNTN